MSEKRHADEDVSMETQNSKSGKSEVQVKSVEWNFRASDQFKIVVPQGSMTMTTEDGNTLTPTELFFKSDKVLDVLKAMGIPLEQKNKD